MSDPSQDRPPGNGQPKPSRPDLGGAEQRARLPHHCARFLDIDAAHRLINHPSKCRHLHGHRYHIRVLCEGPLDDIGVVIDFGEIKARVGKWLDDNSSREGSTT